MDRDRTTCVRGWTLKLSFSFLLHSVAMVASRLFFYFFRLVSATTLSSCIRHGVWEHVMHPWMFVQTKKGG